MDDLSAPDELGFHSESSPPLSGRGDDAGDSDFDDGDTPLLVRGDWTDADDEVRG